MVEGWLRLAELETLLTAQSLVAMVCTGLGLALLLTSCWLGLLAALALELIASGTSAVLALLLVVLLNGLAAAVAYATFLRQARALGWPASLRAISGGEVAARPGVDPDRDDRNADH